jgi:hypothetical protein
MWEKRYKHRMRQLDTQSGQRNSLKKDVGKDRSLKQQQKKIEK